MQEMIEQYQLNFGEVKPGRRKNHGVKTHLYLFDSELRKNFYFEIFPIQLLPDSTLQVFFNESLHFLFLELTKILPCFRMKFLQIIKYRLVDFSENPSDAIHGAHDF